MMLIYKKIRDLALSKKDREMGCTQKHTMYTAKIKEKIKENQYIRGKEGLVMNITDKKPLTIVQFTLSPAR